MVHALGTTSSLQRSLFHEIFESLRDVFFELKTISTAIGSRRWADLWRDDVLVCKVRQHHLPSDPWLLDFA